MKHNLTCLYAALMLVSAVPAVAQATGKGSSDNGVGTSSPVPNVSGGGTTNFVPVWLTPSRLGNSTIVQHGLRVSVGPTKPNAQFNVRATEQISGVFARGADAPGGSDQNGTDGIDSFGGAADPDSGFASGGAGVVGIGGISSQLISSAGPGGAFMAGNGGGVGVQANCAGAGCLAGSFTGDVHVTGAITASVKHFKIDHPLDPANKYLVHASVESSEMKNIYDGVVVLDRSGEAVVDLPDWFEAVNGNFRYQLTAIGAPSPGLYIAQKISGNRFKIAGGAPAVEVSWQVTAVRQDAFARANPLTVEQTKNVEERGYYIHPELFGESEEKGIEYARYPQLMRRLRELSAKQSRE